MEKSVKNIFTGISVFFLFIALSQFFVQLKIFEQVSSIVVYPFLILQKKIVSPFKSFISNYYSFSDMKDLLDFYKKENEHLQSMLIEFHGIKSFAKSTKEIRDFAKRYDTTNYILAQVLLRNFDEAQHFYLIDAGSNMGIQKDMVVVYKNCLVGRISEVYPLYSKVLLITDKTCKIAAYCISNNVMGIHVGNNESAKTYLTFVNHLETVKNNDLVLSSGEGVIFPRGFGLGYVKECIKQDFNYNIILKPLVDLENLKFCCVIPKDTKIKKIR